MGAPNPPFSFVPRRALGGQYGCCDLKHDVLLVFFSWDSPMNTTPTCGYHMFPDVFQTICAKP